MSTTELGELEALLEKVLPDPRGFAERVFEQMAQRLTTAPPQNPVVDSYDGDAYQALADRNMLLAAAVGACDCWGYEPTCAVCDGAGSAGWARPDDELFMQFVEPAVHRMVDEPGEDPDKDDQTEEGQRA